jgi:hypothetical protein
MTASARRGSLFDVVAHADDRPARPDEPSFSYMNVSGRPEIGRIRTLLEEWFERYPIEAAADLRGRFRSKTKRVHLAAFFELYVHELMRRTGSNPGVHPSAPGSKRTTRPDFSGSLIDGTQFFVEATMTSDSSLEEQAASVRKNQFYAFMEQLESPHFMLMFKERGRPRSTVPMGEWRKQIATFVSANDRALVRFDENTDFSDLPALRLTHDGWNVTTILIPRSKRKEGAASAAATAGYMFEPAVVSPHITLREAIRKKASRGTCQWI